VAINRVQLLSPFDNFHFGDVRSIGEDNMAELVFEPLLYQYSVDAVVIDSTRDRNVFLATTSMATASSISNILRFILERWLR
jgi:hypothetical protein